MGEVRMSRERMEVHYNNMDIVQRLMAEKMIGQFPLKILNFQTARVRDVLSTDLPDIKTKDHKADTLYLLEDGTFLHIEYQTTAKKHDSYRFAGYIMDLYNKYKDDKRFSTFTFQSVVIYAPSIQRTSVNTVFDIGAIRYNYSPLFLNEVQKKDEYMKIIDKIR